MISEHCPPTDRGLVTPKKAEGPLAEVLKTWCAGLDERAPELCAQASLHDL